ncbi:MAG TPA: hypothetical protein VER55_16380, partial [Ardenticatenaceae bacterium]|nr:hypothetical protein [Ardenticatenaceae bacterium]
NFISLHSFYSTSAWFVSDASFTVMVMVMVVVIVRGSQVGSDVQQLTPVLYTRASGAASKPA